METMAIINILQSIYRYTIINIQTIIISKYQKPDLFKKQSNYDIPAIKWNYIASTYFSGLSLVVFASSFCSVCLLSLQTRYGDNIFIEAEGIY